MTEIKEQLSQLNKMSNKSEALYHKCLLYKNSLLNGFCVLCARAKHDSKSDRTRYLTISHSFVPNAKVKCLSVSNNFIYLLSKSQTRRRRADNP